MTQNSTAKNSDAYVRGHLSPAVRKAVSGVACKTLVGLWCAKYGDEWVSELSLDPYFLGIALKLHARKLLHTQSTTNPPSVSYMLKRERY